MAGQSGADQGQSTAATQAPPSAGTAANAAQAPAPPVGQQPDELLCTICGLTACWTAPGKPPRPATATESAADTAATK